MFFWSFGWFCHSPPIACRSVGEQVVTLVTGVRGGLLFDPWVELARFPHIEVRVERLNGSVAGLTDGRNLIWLDDRLNQVESRCVLTHELIHLFMQHTSCQPLMTELIVCQRAARKLITLEGLARVLPWAMCLKEAAEELAVTPQTLRDRLQSLSPEESALLETWEAMRAA